MSCCGELWLVDPKTGCDVFPAELTANQMADILRQEPLSYHGSESNVVEEHVAPQQVVFVCDGRCGMWVRRQPTDGFAIDEHESAGVSWPDHMFPRFCQSVVTIQTDIGQHHSWCCKSRILEERNAAGREPPTCCPIAGTPLRPGQGVPFHLENPHTSADERTHRNRAVVARRKSGVWPVGRRRHKWLHTTTSPSPLAPPAPSLCRTYATGSRPRPGDRNCVRHPSDTSRSSWLRPMVCQLSCGLRFFDNVAGWSSRHFTLPRSTHLSFGKLSLSLSRDRLSAPWTCHPSSTS